MLWIHADRYGLDAAERRRTFKAMSFSPWLSNDGLSGTLTLHPEVTVLNVGSSADDYKCVRVFAEDGRIIGTMRRSPAGEVTWHGPTGVHRV